MPVLNMMQMVIKVNRKSTSTKYAFVESYQLKSPKNIQSPSENLLKSNRSNVA